MKNIEKNIGLLNIRVDYRTELLGIIEIISDYRKKYPHLLEKYANKAYIERIEKDFSKFKEHPVIKIFNNLVDRYGFSYDAPVGLFLQLDDNFNCDSLDSYLFETRLQRDTDIYKLLKSLPDFTKQIDFETFYLSNTKLYETFVDDIEKSLEGYSFIDYMLHYYNLPIDKNFIINLIPFQSNGNYGTNNNQSIFSNIGVYNDKENEREEDIYKRDGLVLSCTLFHEFSHSFINPLTDKYNLITNDDHLFDEIKDTMKNMAYTNSATILNEHIIRALTIRYINSYGKYPKYYQKRMQLEKDRSFIYIENVINSLIEYENNQCIYTTIDAYYPIIVDNMKKEYETRIAINK